MKSPTILTLAFFSALFVASCNENSIRDNTQIKKGLVAGNITHERFSDFYNKFYTDSVFQLQRIKFPLPGLNTDDQDIGDNKVYYWQKSKWLRNYLPDKKICDVKTTETNTLVTERVSSKDDPGLIITSRFKLIGSKWYLIRFEDINL